MSLKKVVAIIAIIFGLLALNWFIFSTVMELLRQRNDIEVFIGMVLVPCIVIFDYLSIIKINKLTKQ